MELSRIEEWVALWITVGLVNQQTTPERLHQIVDAMPDPFACTCGSHPLAPLYHRDECPNRMQRGGTLGS